ncbi:uncharacterized protein LOC129727810 [Wyeomyia smithii]|uniref:uncharacterized protein LOC129727810 n=1 Tax=Wyeomyia smithii TaxID=174621 RepID=UPI0024680BE0|nr:uncharacterized protein LOC129727810 [Wyeomyia smithii]XP_055541989.1 uncharacterized protein LOC129727810 [Wyeomyia smithii]
MFAVVQFIENNKFQVLAVPVSWVKSGNLMWPKMSNEKIEALRATGTEFHGATKRIPVIISRKVRNFLAAEKIADELTKKEVSDVEGKMEKLKPPKKSIFPKNKNYNTMLAAIQKIPNKGQELPGPTSMEYFDRNSQDTSEVMHNEMPLRTQQQSKEIQHTQSVVIQQPIPSTPVASSMILQMPPPEPQIINGEPANTLIIETLPTLHQNKESIYCTGEDYYFVSDARTDQQTTDTQIITANNEANNHEELKKDLQQFIQTTVETVVERCFDDHFSKLTALMQMNIKSSNKTTLEVYDDPVENHLIMKFNCTSGM